MMRTHARPQADRELTLNTCHDRCWICGGPLWVAYHNRRTVQMLTELVRLTLPVRRCQNSACAHYRRPYRPEQEGAYALPHGEFGLDVIAHVGAWRYGHHRSVPEIHQDLVARGGPIAERSVTEQLRRYEELVALRLADSARLAARLQAQGHVILALDGLQPDVGHEVLWVLRDCLSGEILLARSLLSATEEAIAALLKDVRAALPVPIRGVISDGQHPIRRAVARVLSGVPHQLCQFHYLREAAKPISEADRHAKTQLKKHVRGVRPIERALEGRVDAEAEAVRGYCLAVRSALTDDGRAPLCASGLTLHHRLEAIIASIARVAEKRGSQRSWRACTGSWRLAWPRPRPAGRTSVRPMRGSIARQTCSAMRRGATCSPSAGSTGACSPKCSASRSPSAISGLPSPAFAR